MEKKSPLIIGIGELLWDMLPTGKKAGGAPVNLVYHATQLGADGYAISAIGKDELGEEILKALTDNGIKYSITRNDHPTGQVDVSLSDGIPRYTIMQDVAWDYIQASAQAVDLVQRAQAVCFGTLAFRSEESRQNIEILLNSCPKETVRFFDVNLRSPYYSRDLIDHLLQKADIFKVNEEELSILQDMFSLSGGTDEVCRELIRRYNLGYMIFTAGEKYSAIYTSCEKSEIATPKVAVCDTVGAGDSFSGAFICNILNGRSFYDAHKSAVKTAAFVSTKSGAWPSYEDGTTF